MLQVKNKVFSAILLPIMVLLIAFCFAACGESPDTDANLDFENNNILVTYFSATGNTERVANYISSYLNADLVEITPAVPYTSADLNWNDSDSRVSQEHNDSSIRPEIDMDIPNISEYDIVFLGYPIWWGQAPNIVYTFLETYGASLNGATIIPFCTSSSSPLGTSATNLHSLVDGTWLNGQRFSSGASQASVESWIDGLSI